MELADLEDRARSGDVRAQVSLAASLDAQGRHEDAINWLSRAAQAGDAESLATLGFRLLSGRNAPAMPKQGAGLLSDAAARGNAEAAAMISVLAGGGFYGQQSWPVALDYLQRSAELGGQSARAQLHLLAGAHGAAVAAGPPAELWRRLRQSVDVAAWTSAPSARTLCPTPLVRAFEGLAPPDVCDWLIQQSRPRLERALVHDPSTGLTIMGETRTNQVANFALDQTSLVHLFIQARIGAAVGGSMTMMEAFAVLHYAVGEEASEHFDYLDPAIPNSAAGIASYGQRVATCLLFLNEDYQGGETAFPVLGISHRGRKGDALAFQSVDAAGAPDPRTLHAGRPPTSGEKWVLSQFIRNRALAPGTDLPY